MNILFFLYKYCYFYKYHLANLNDALKETIKKLYETKAIQKFYKSKQFRILNRKNSLYGLDADCAVAYKKFNISEEEQSTIEKFILKKITKQVTLDIITVTLWVLTQHYGDSKLGLESLLLYFINVIE